MRENLKNRVLPVDGINKNRLVKDVMENILNNILKNVLTTMLLS